MAKYPHIGDLDCCPHCGSDFAFYTKVYAYGHLIDRRLFESHEPYNFEMHDALTYGKDSDYFCDACDQKIATVKSSQIKKEQK